MWTLAQAAGMWGDPNAVTPLTQTPVLQRLLFEEPLPLIIALAAAGVVGFILLNQRAKLRAGLIALSLGLIAAAAVWLTARLVTTDREALRAAAAELVDAVSRADAPRLRPLLAADVTLQPGSRSLPIPLSQGPDSVISLVERSLGKAGIHPIDSAEIMENQATLDGPGVGRSQVRVRVIRTGGSGFHTFAWIRVDWRREANTWKARTIEPLAVWLPGANLGSSRR